MTSSRSALDLNRIWLNRVAVLVAWTTCLCLGVRSSDAQTFIRVEQESSPGAGDFECNFLGVIQAWDFDGTAAAFYDYGGSNDVSSGFSWAYGPIVNRSHWLFANTTDGLTLVFIHDAPRVSNGGGSASTLVDVVSDTPISRTVDDDPIGDGEMPYGGEPGDPTFTADHVWLNFNTDGQALSGFSGAWSAIAQFTAPPTSLNQWFVESVTGGYIPLSLTPGRRVRFTPAPVQPANSLLALYTFDDGSYRDVSGQNRLAYKAGNAAQFPNFVMDGYEGMAVRVAVDRWLGINLNISPSVHERVTIGTWVRPESATPRQFVMSHDDGGFDRSFGIDNRAGNGWSCFAGGGGGNNGSGVLGSRPVTVGEWRLIAAVYDPTAEVNSRVRLYVDGAESLSGPGVPGSGNVRLFVGRSPFSATPYSGLVDNVFVLSEALSIERLDEIRAGGYHKIPTQATIFRQPACTSVCPVGTASISIDAGGAGTVTYQWQREEAANSGNFVNLSDGSSTPWGGGGVIAGTASAALQISADLTGGQRLNQADAIRYRCIVTNAFGTAISEPACLRVCPPDFTCDGFINTSDFFDFLTCFFGGACPPNQSADYNGDGFVNTQDFFDFLAAFFAGC